MEFGGGLFCGFFVTFVIGAVVSSRRDRARIDELETLRVEVLNLSSLLKASEQGGESIAKELASRLKTEMDDS